MITAISRISRHFLAPVRRVAPIERVAERPRKRPPYAIGSIVAGARVVAIYPSTSEAFVVVFQPVNDMPEFARIVESNGTIIQPQRPAFYNEHPLPR